ncbi:MAG: hypothetical protein CM1200mP33_0100 [Chloroflexota bacterium]|nr:MAG: hypothetical protein CM1200mP33_0100 [Chloroflexota bacterium]
MKINKRNLRILFDKVTIEKRVEEMAIELSNKFENKKPIFIRGFKWEFYICFRFIKKS